ncbi:MAG: hypothetical protein Q8P40_13815 [Nitrospirota bacterium]|nr:hypothetical protein [Nitrospirota bacterium]
MTLTEAKPIKNQGTKIKITAVNDALSVEEINKLLQCTREIERNKEGRVIDVFLDISDINITAKDTFSVEELKKLAQCIREIEQNKPDRHINVLYYTPEKTVKEMEAVMDSVKPGMPFKTVIEFGKKGK